MTVVKALLEARHIGVRDLREHLSKRLKEKKAIVITEHGTPTRVIFAYQDVVELIEVLDELQDRAAIQTVWEGRKAIKAGAEGVPVSRLFRRIRESRN
jgi:antitoxin (DNA-binding transcriptional repressor) of toxin-antitoxin stability system